MPNPDKYELLKTELSSCGRVSIAFSAGVDSALLLYAAHEALGDNVLAITADSPVYPKSELGAAVDFCRRYGIRHEIFDPGELACEEYAENPPDRCYICKHILMGRMLEISKSHGIDILAEGSNTDDEGDYRPGMRAIRELGIRSPLREAGLSKKEIREISRKIGLSTWDKPSYACLASRIPYGDRITETKLNMIGQAERVLKDMGFEQCRVRVHGDLARIELEEERLADVMSTAKTRHHIHDRFKQLGFSYVSLDIMGYRTGSMNEVLDSKDYKDDKKG